ncbi:MAG: Response regulator containing a CheY-like receiver domain and an DNA-binding domain [Frankiales bacterium]|nr:Response regulator containing a CheY-like receiver domain and an DNA-binding domain [Frankiales bacterium]
MANTRSDAGAEPSVLELTRERLRAYVRAATLPMLLLELPSGLAHELSDAMSELLGVDRQQALGTAAPGYTEDSEASRVSLQMLSDGYLDGYSKRVLLPTGSGDVVEVDVRVDACDGRAPDRMAVATVLRVLPDPYPAEPALLEAHPRAASPVTGTMTAGGVIDRVVKDAGGVLPEPATVMLGRSLLDVVHPQDAGAVMMLAAHASARAASVTGRARFRTANGGWHLVRLALQSLAPNPSAEGAAGFAFALSTSLPPDPALQPLEATAARFQAIAERNAQDLSAAAAVAAERSTQRPPLRPHPGLDLLTDRELQIVVRLLAAQRVPAIAKELFLSQSTVRNHLTAVYRKLGVHSQGALVEVLRVR